MTKSNSTFVHKNILQSHFCLKCNIAGMNIVCLSHNISDGCYDQSLRKSDFTNNAVTNCIGIAHGNDININLLFSDMGKT